MDSFNPTYRISNALARDLMSLAYSAKPGHISINLTHLTLSDLYACCGTEHTLRNQENATFLPASGTMHAYPSPTTLHGHLEAWLTWLKASQTMPLPIVAALTYQHLMALRPLPKDNQKLAKNIADLLLAQGGYPKGLLDQLCKAQYQQHLLASLSETDQSTWVAWFCHHLVQQTMQVIPDMRKLNNRQRKILALFADKEQITSLEVGKQLGVKSRARAHICQKWVEDGFFAIANPSNKARTYSLTIPYQKLLAKKATA
jgi:hypothetical protein